MEAATRSKIRDVVSRTLPPQPGHAQLHADPARNRDAIPPHMRHEPIEAA